MSGASMSRLGLWIDRYLVPVAVALSLAVSVALVVASYTAGTLSNPVAAVAAAVILVLSVASLALIPRHVSRGKLYTDLVKLLYFTWIAIVINAVPGIVISDAPPLPLWIRIVFALLPAAPIAKMIKLVRSPNI
ncbi:hypothetical protein Igag_0309 [Ignisphaera aggregans DSM 17230]|uniref:Uncharacterized protein n=1 Tax=Ignisphaera aggregans (strain DSM 17230 / JCM 13409 / AQ1.S1) TaxID=583356 RepID=E0SQT1_IGNAA|nr:hypothetical protein Igag_0309 [Ignisphaera aggregans DSM 17230]